MSTYTIALFIHVASAVALLSGSVVGSPAVRAAVRKAASTGELRAYLRIGRPLLVLEPAGALLVLASGIYLTAALNAWALGWIQVSIATWVVSLIVAATLVKPGLDRLAAAATRAGDGAVGQDLDGLRSSPRWLLGGDVLSANDAAILFVMVARPGVTASLFTVILANAGVISTRLLTGRGAAARSARAAARPVV